MLVEWIIDDSQFVISYLQMEANITNMVFGTNNTTESFHCVQTSEEEELLFKKLAYAIDGVGHIIVGLIGIIGNSLAIPVLISKRLNSIFNRILVFLAIFDNIFISCSVMEGIRKNFGAIAEWHNYAFAYFG